MWLIAQQNKRFAIVVVKWVTFLSLLIAREVLAKKNKKLQLHKFSTEKNDAMLKAIFKIGYRNSKRNSKSN